MGNRLGALFALLLLLTACATPQDRVPPPNLAFRGEPPIGFDVARTEVTITYEPPATTPHVEHLFTLPPSRAAAIWGQERLEAVGNQRVLHFYVREAPVVEVPLAIEGGIKGAFMRQQSFRYDARLVIEAEIVEDTGFTSAEARVTAARSVTLREDADPVERERTWNRLVEELMADADVQLEATLSEVFEAYRR